MKILIIAVAIVLVAIAAIWIWFRHHTANERPTDIWRDR